MPDFDTSTASVVIRQPLSVKTSLDNSSVSQYSVIIIILLAIGFCNGLNGFAGMETSPLAEIKNRILKLQEPSNVEISLSPSPELTVEGYGLDWPAGNGWSTRSHGIADQVVVFLFYAKDRF